MSAPGGSIYAGASPHPDDTGEGPPRPRTAIRVGAATKHKQQILRGISELSVRENVRWPRKSRLKPTPPEAASRLKPFDV